MKVNGLYGHVRSNDVRSLALFAGFVAAFHVLAILALLVPLAMLDPDHAPLYGWTGYLVRWVPIITAVGTLLFAAQMAWHVRVVRRRMDFRFVDGRDEPRLFRIVEPLAIAAGLTTPHIGVIDSPALNAFACGIRRKDAVLVFTRGLIDGLDDDELAAVAAHEITHIVNGDIRLIAATNVCLDTLKLLQHRRNPKRTNRVWEAMSLPMLALAMPLMFVLVLAVSFLRQLAVDASHLTRKMIASAREFIADAEAVRLTHNPAALVSALRGIEGRSAIPGLGAGQDAMMIDGAHQGPMATHPTVAERIAAIVAVTGSMTAIAPARRDTRPAGWQLSRPVPLNVGGGFGRRRAAIPEVESGAAGGALARLLPADGFNRFGLTREMTIGAVAAIGAFLWVHGAELGNPTAMAKAFDPAPLRTVFAMGGKGLICQLHGPAYLLGMSELPADCSEAAINEMLTQHQGADGILGKMAKAAAQTNGMFTSSNGTFSNVAPPEVTLANLRAARCFATDRYSVGDRGLYKLDGSPAGNGGQAPDEISMERYLGYKRDSVTRVTSAQGAELGPALLDYIRVRELMLMVVHRFFGEPGLRVLQESYASPADAAVLKLMAARFDAGDPGLRADPATAAKVRFLVTAPADFLPCQARRAAG